MPLRSALPGRVLENRGGGVDLYRGCERKYWWSEDSNLGMGRETIWEERNYTNRPPLSLSLLLEPLYKTTPSTFFLVKALTTP